LTPGEEELGAGMELTQTGFEHDPKTKLFIFLLYALPTTMRNT